MDSTRTLRPPRHLASRRAIRYWATRAAVGWLVLVGAQVVWLLAEPHARGLHVAGLVATAVLGVVHVSVMPRWRYRVHRWEITDEAVYTQSGWLDQERRFGLVNVTVTTASAAGPLKIHGLDRETAERLVEQLTTNTQAERGDAT